MGDLLTYVCPHCESPMMSDYRVCPLCNNEPKNWREELYRQAQKILAEIREQTDRGEDTTEAEAKLVKFLGQGVKDDVQCVRCRLVKRPQDECCFAVDGRMLPETAAKLPEPDVAALTTAMESKAIRAQQGWTQSEYADKTSTSLRKIRLIESGYSSIVNSPPAWLP